MTDAESKREGEPRSRRSSRPVGAHGQEVGATLAAPAAPRRQASPLPGPRRRCARGLVLLSIDAEIERRFGEEGRERVVALLPDAHAEELRRGRPSALEAHDIEAVRVYVEIASRVLGLDVGDLRELGRAAVEREIAPFVKTLILPATLPEVIQRCPVIVGRFMDFGSWKVDRATTEVGVLHVSDFGMVSPLLRSWYVGVLHGIVERAVSPDVTVSDVTAGDPGSSTFHIEVLLESPLRDRPPPR